jgi:hypothetical protein
MPIKKLISEQSKLADAANLAVATIAAAAAEATKVIARAASEASSLVTQKSSLDHDLLIELRTRMDNLREDIKTLSDGTTVKIAEHESRISTIEGKGSKQAVLITVIIALGFIATTLLVYHMFGVKI